MKLIEPYLIRLQSPARSPKWPAEQTKPETVVHAEVLGIRERYAFETLHYHTIEQPTCQICGKAGRMVWTDSLDLFQRDTNRCGNVPVIEVSTNDETL